MVFLKSLQGTKSALDARDQPDHLTNARRQIEIRNQVKRPDMTDLQFLLETANKALLDKDDVAAIRAHVRLLAQGDDADDLIRFNLSIARHRWRRMRTGQAPLVGIFGWEMGHNAAGRAQTLFDLHSAYARKAQVSLMGGVFPNWGGALWAPLEGMDPAPSLIHVAEDAHFPARLFDFVLQTPLDIVHLSKPRMPALLAGLLYRLIWDAEIILDIDDEELGAIKATEALPVTSIPRGADGLASWKNLTGGKWTRIAVGLVRHFTRRTVSNPALQARYGGDLLPHARDAQRFAQARSRRDETRAMLKLPSDATVVLFAGTVRGHKGVIESVHAVRAQGRPDLHMVVAGDIPDAELASQLAALAGPDLHLLPAQTWQVLPDLVAAGDITILLQDEKSLLAEYQLPAKLVDALAGGLVVMATPTPALADMVAAGAVQPVHVATLASELSSCLSDPARMATLRARGQDYFADKLSVAAQAPLVESLQVPSAATPVGVFLPDGLNTMLDALGGLQAFVAVPAPAEAPPKLPQQALPATINAAETVRNARHRLGRDAFMLRGLRPQADIAIVIRQPDAETLDATLANLAGVGAAHDLFVLGEVDTLLPRLPAQTVTITETGLTDNGTGRAFLRLAASNALDDYRAVLWLDNAAPLSGPSCPQFLADHDWGMASAETARLAPTAADSRLLAALRTALPRLGLMLPEGDLVLPVGTAIWLRPILLRGLATALRPDELNAETGKTGFPGVSSILAVLSLLAREAGFDIRSAPVAPPSVPARPRSLKTVAFYLPQFHPIPENDLWWGKGFTEWTNVTRARQLFRAHYQPRVPTELGYYDLRLEDTQIAQAELARDFGIHGFCFYYYWFAGKKLLNHPIEQMAKSTRIDAGFCACWANENWSRNWDGQNRHVLMEQAYTLDSNIALIQELIPMMKDPRWIRQNGKPVMMVYRISIIPNWMETAAAWRDECRKAGLGEIHLCAVRFGLETLQGPPQDYGLDSYVLFPPHEAARLDLRDKVHDLHKDFNGQIFDYTAVVDGDLEVFSEGYDWPVHRGAMLGWDNTARRLTDARVFHGATPYGFRRWMKGILQQEQDLNPNEESLVFINAWNEWAEGTYLEPDQRWGRNYLRAFASASDATTGVTPALLPRGVAAAPRGVTALERLGNPEADTALRKPPRWHAGKRAHNPDWPTVLLCAHISGHQLFGGERSLLDVLDALASLPLNVVMTLPSGNNKDYIREICARSLGTYSFRYPQWWEDRDSYGWLATTFADIIARHAVDLVHANTIVIREPLDAAARMARIRVTHARELVSLDDPLRERMGLGVSDILQRVYERSDWVIGNSRVTTQLFSRPGKTLYVPNAVTMADFDMGNKFGNAIKFGIVSSNIPKKGVGDFVEVARRVAAHSSRAKFVIVGPVNDQVKAWQAEVAAGTRPDNLIFAGYADNPRTAMSHLNVLLNLSHFAESFGRTVAEAMAARRPVIAYDWGALSELVQHGETGILAPYRDVQAVVDAVLSLCADDRQIHRMGEAGRAFVGQHFAQDNLRAALTDGYTSMLGRPMSGPDAGTPSPTAARSIGLPPARTTVIVPVYNAPDEVRDCLRSVLKHTDLTQNRLLVIDDGSPDPAVAPMLAEFDGIAGVTILRNTPNIGYTKTINLGIREAGGDDVILLNSDTVVTPRWLEGLRSTAYSRPKVATVTAMSDNAGAFSFPHFNEYCPRPAHMTHEDYALLITQATRNCTPPEVPTGSGFCFYIRRALIDACGLFDEEGFPRGYGEENDFCMRAFKAGWVNLVSPWSFVYHVRTASFKGEKTALVKAGVDVVTKRYPEYAAAVKAAFAGPEMMALRAASGRVGESRDRVNGRGTTLP